MEPPQTEENLPDQDQVHHPVLSLSLLLEQIFSTLTFPDLKTCRLVSHLWREAATPILSVKGCLNVRKIFLSNTIAWTGISDAIDPILTRNVTISHDSYKGATLLTKSEIENSVSLLFPKFSAKFHESMRSISYGGRSLLNNSTGLAEALRDVGFPNLVKISLKNFSFNMYYNEVTHLQEMPSLKSLDLEIKKAYPEQSLDVLLEDEDVDISNSFFQALVSAAPNLVELSVSGHFYPNLGWNGKLEIIRTKGLPIPMVSSMLGQVSTSLKTLIMERSQDSSTRDFSHTLNLPFMAKLSTLDIKGLPSSCLNPQQLSPANVPQLQKMKVQDILVYLPLHETLRSLEVDLGWSPFIPNNFYTILASFPSLESVRVNFDGVLNGPDAQSIILSMLYTIQAADTFKKPELEISSNIYGGIRFSRLVKILETCGHVDSLSAVRKLKIRIRAWTGMILDFDDIRMTFFARIFVRDPVQDTFYPANVNVSFQDQKMVHNLKDYGIYFFRHGEDFPIVFMPY